MIEPETNRAIEDYLEKVAKLLPESFETEDVLEDLRSHITEALLDRLREDETASQLTILSEVLEEIGEPEEIAEEFGHAKLVEDESDHSERLRRIALRLVVSVPISIAAAWFVSNLATPSIDFWTALVVFLVFALLESFVRSWQVKRPSD
ncbi:MAG: HAAS signaling domain-containing protein [Candidatus Thorarchaeota archaeon]